MESLSSVLDLRSFQALLNSIAKRQFYGEADITNEYLVEQLYAGTDLEASVAETEINAFQEAVMTGAAENWDALRFAEYLRARNLPADHTKVAAAFWNKESEKINKRLLKDATWNNTYEHLSWRVDVKTMSRASTEMNEPTAFFDFSCKRGHLFEKQEAGSSSQTENAKVEMDRTELNNILSSLNDIQKKIEEAS
jgi:hypothetical protein